MLTAYKAYKAMLNVNTVTESSTMCARRVFEILASGTNVISTPSKALAALFGPGEVYICATEQDVEHAVTSWCVTPSLPNAACTWPSAGSGSSTRTGTAVRLSFPPRPRTWGWGQSGPG